MKKSNRLCRQCRRPPSVFKCMKHYKLVTLFDMTFHINMHQWFIWTMNTYFSNNNRKTCIYYWYVLKCALVPCTKVFNVVSNRCSDASHLCKYCVTNAFLIFNQSSQCKLLTQSGSWVHIILGCLVSTVHEQSGF